MPFPLPWLGTILAVVLVALIVPTCQKIVRTGPDSQELWPWPLEGVAEVKFYLINPDEPSAFTPLVLGDGSLNETRLPKEGVALTDEQELALREALLRGRPDYPKAMCFYPHHSFVLLDSESRMLGVIDVCFQCLNHSGPKGIEEYIDFAVVADIVEQLGYPVDVSPPDSELDDPFATGLELDPFAD